MPLMKTTWIFGLARHGFTESWYRQASTADPKVEMIAAKEYAVERAKLLGWNSSIQAIRISNADDRRQKAYTEYVDYPGNQEVDGNGVHLHGSAASNVALNMNWFNINFTQQKLIQLRGIWDDFEADGGSPQLGNPVYIGLIQGWGAKVDALGYGWIATTSITTQDITLIVVNTDGTISITVSGNLFTVDQVNAKKNLPVRVTDYVPSPNLNGQLTVFPINQTTMVSIRPIALTAHTVAGKVTRNVKAFTQGSGGRIQRLGNRQAGAPLLQSVGRGRVRARG